MKKRDSRDWEKRRRSGWIAMHREVVHEATGIQQAISGALVVVEGRRDR